MEPRTVATLALTSKGSYHSARSHPHSDRSHPLMLLKYSISRNGILIFFKSECEYRSGQHAPGEFPS
jgi:hypothetical protein